MTDTTKSTAPGMLALEVFENSNLPLDHEYGQSALADLRALIAERDALVRVAEEIAASGCDLGDSERRIRLYAAITRAGGVL